MTQKQQQDILKNMINRKTEYSIKTDYSNFDIALILWFMVLLSGLVLATIKFLMEV